MISDISENPNAAAKYGLDGLPGSAVNLAGA
jgi:hypothetical protein